MHLGGAIDPTDNAWAQSLQYFAIFSSSDMDANFHSDSRLTQSGAPSKRVHCRYTPVKGAGAPGALYFVFGWEYHVMLQGRITTDSLTAVSNSTDR